MTSASLGLPYPSPRSFSPEDLTCSLSPQIISHGRSLLRSLLSLLPTLPCPSLHFLQHLKEGYGSRTYLLCAELYGTPDMGIMLCFFSFYPSSTLLWSLIYNRYKMNLKCQALSKGHKDLFIQWWFFWRAYYVRKCAQSWEILASCSFQNSEGDVIQTFNLQRVIKLPWRTAEWIYSGVILFSLRRHGFAMAWYKCIKWMKEWIQLVEEEICIKKYPTNLMQFIASINPCGIKKKKKKEAANFNQWKSQDK